MQTKTFEDYVSQYRRSPHNSAEETQALQEVLDCAKEVSQCLEFAQFGRGDDHCAFIYKRAQALTKAAHESAWIYDRVIGSGRDTLLPIALESIRDAIARAAVIEDRTERLQVFVYIAFIIRIKPNGRGNQYLKEVLAKALELAPDPEA